MDESELEPYATREILGVEKDEDGQPEYDLGDWEIDSEVIENYINDNLEHLTIGKGLEDYENTQSDLVELDDDLKSELKTLARYQKDSNSYLKAIDSEGFEINESLRMIVRDKKGFTKTKRSFRQSIGIQYRAWLTLGLEGF